MLSGAQFVGALGRLGYPRASSLKAAEFDWLFDCAPDNLYFLRFVCQTLNQSNVLTPEEVAAFQELQKSGKPILDEAALAEVLNPMHFLDGSGSKITGLFSSASSLLGEDGDLATEDLEAELEALCREKEQKQRRYNKLQVMTTSRTNAELQLAAELESTTHELRDTGASIAAENADTNTVLQKLKHEVDKLRSYLPQPEQNEDAVALPISSKSSGSTSLLSQISLEPYLRQEELNTKSLSALTQKHFFPGISEIVESSCLERFQILDLSCCEDDEVEQNEPEGQNHAKRAVHNRRTEMARLQWSHIVAQHQLMRAAAEEKSLKAGLDWLSHKSGLTRSFSTSSALNIREVVSRKELQVVEAELEALLHGAVPSTLRESARLLNVPVVRGDLALQLARQDYYTSRQHQVRDYLLRQKASFDLVLLAQEIEMRKWKMCHKHLSDVEGRLVKESQAAAQRIEVLAHPDLAINPKPSQIITSKDVSFSRLLQILKQTSSQSCPEPFQTYGALDQAACELAHNIRATQESVAGACHEQNYTAARLHGDCEMLHRAMYTTIQQLILKPQVCPAAGNDQEVLCPNAQELSLKITEAETQLQNLQRLMQEIQSDIKSKRVQLERNALLRQERELYIYFHLDAGLLQKKVEDLEMKAGKKVLQ